VVEGSKNDEGPLSLCLFARIAKHLPLHTLPTPSHTPPYSAMTFISKAFLLAGAAMITRASHQAMQQGKSPPPLPPSLPPLASLPPLSAHALTPPFPNTHAS